MCVIFFFQAEDGILDAQGSRGLGDVYKRQEVKESLFSDRVRLIAPVIMGAACVSCHNSHVESVKKDWKVGDVRGLQEVSITQPFADNLF